MAAAGATAWAGKAAAVRKEETAPVTDRRQNDEAFGLMQAFGDMREVYDNLLFGNPDSFGEIPGRERLVREFGHDALSRGHVGLL
jgi:hypothetical protein